MGSCISPQIEQETSRERSLVDISYDLSYDKKAITSQVYYSPKHNRLCIIGKTFDLIDDF